jgi:uncharacterized protein YjbI with pentapeptide repeats
MRERFQQWRHQRKIPTGWVMGAIATPVLLGIVGGLGMLPARGLQASDSLPSPTEGVTPTDPDRETPISGMGAIATVTVGVLLLLNVRSGRNKAEITSLSHTNLKNANLKGIDLSGANLNDIELCNANLSGADLSGADLINANLNGANLSGANLSGADLVNANLNGADLNGAGLRYANLSGADLRYANLSRSDLRYANLSGANLNCALLTDANLSEADLSGALLFFINSREALNLEPLQLEAQPSPFLCNVALPSYSNQREVDPNRDCHRMPQLLSDRYDIPLEEAQGIVEEARQHRWD